MAQQRFVRACALALAVLVLLPAAARAQAAIAGVVKDTSGAVMPGVTVEASSPALIEKTRTVVSDGQGLYKFTDLRPGIYSVVFTLSGFNTVRREGLELPDAFTATVNADLRVGAVEETITVSGQAPLVDVQTVAQHTVLANTVLDSLPSTRFLHGYVAYLPGMSGTTLGLAAHYARAITFHGSRAGQFIIQVDGFSTAFMSSYSGISSSFFLNQAQVQETNIQTGGASAEQQFGGVQPNVIPKEGGNGFTGYLYTSYANEHMQSDNLTDEFRAKGLTNVNKNKKIFDINPAVGGKIIQDKLWFFASGKVADLDRYRSGIYYDANQADYIYTPDLTKPVHHTEVSDYDYLLHLTYQPSPRNKITLHFDQQPHWMNQRNAEGQGTGATAAPEAVNWVPYWPNAFYSVKYRSPISNKFLLETGAAVYSTGINTNPPKDPTLAGDPYKVAAVLEQNTNICFRASACINGWVNPDNVSYQTRTAVSYVTGSHAAKFGFQTLYGFAGTSTEDFDYRITSRGGIPNTLTQIIKPDERRSYAFETGIFAQDQWTLRKATFNYGLRFDYQTGWVPAQDLPAGPYVAARHFDKKSGLPSFTDLSPRLGVAYDLFGNGRTALKGTFNRYVDLGGNGISSANDPVTLSVLSATRSWTDSNGNFNPDCDLSSVLAQNLSATGGDVCGALSDANFGKPNPRSLGYSADAVKGFGKRQYNWEISAQVEQQLMTGVSVELGYFRRWYGNLVTTDNLLVAPSDYQEYCVTAPSDVRLPGGGGQQICGLFDFLPTNAATGYTTKFGQVANQVNAQKNYGDRTDDWRGIDATLNVRLKQGTTISGGLSTGRSHTVNCSVVDIPGGGTSATTPNSYCDTLQPYQTQLKFLWRIPTPWWGLELSGVIQNLPGQNQTATFVYTASQTTLGRTFVGGSATTTRTVDLINPNTEYFKRANQVDLRIAKSFTIQKYKFTTGMDFFNLLNGAQLQTYQTRLDDLYPRPVEVQPARYMSLNAVMTF